MNIYGNLNLNKNITDQSVPLTQLTASATLNLAVTDNGSVYSLNSGAGTTVNLPAASTLPVGWNITLYNDSAINTVINTDGATSDVLNFSFTTMTLSAFGTAVIRLVDTGVFSFSSVNPFKILTMQTPVTNFVYGGSSPIVVPLCESLPTGNYDFVILSAAVELTDCLSYVSSPTMSIEMNGTLGNIAAPQQFPAGTPTINTVYQLALRNIRTRGIPGNLNNSLTFTLSATGAAASLQGYCMVSGYVTQNTFPNDSTP